MLRKIEQGQVYQPSSVLQSRPSELNRPFEDVFIPVEKDVRISAWFFPGEPAGTNSQKVFLVCHGNGGNISHRLDLCDPLLKTGAGVLIFDYRGYGQSSGKPDEEGTYRDGQAAYQWLCARKFASTNIYLYGESLGGGVATELALREPAAGLILQSTFTSIRGVGAELLPWFPGWLNHIKYDTRSKLPKVKIPVLVIHSRQDTLIRFHHAEENFAAANPPKYFCEITGNHNDGFHSTHRQFVEAVGNLINNTLSSR